jgi:hypothetical protein
LPCRQFQDAIESVVVRGPPISIRCECGETRSVGYGELWECESCGRRWNTRQIPAEEYHGVQRAMRRWRLIAIGAVLAVLAAYVPLVLLVGEGVLLTAPILLAAVAILLGPLWKRQVRRVIAERPRWDLHAEEPAPK